MCGRTGLAIDVATLTDRFDATPTDAVDAYLPCYNIAPGDGLVTITNDQPDTADLSTWGFSPEWVDNASTPINARAHLYEHLQHLDDDSIQLAAAVRHDWSGRWQV